MIAIYLHLSTQIINTVPAFEHIDLYNNQYETSSKEHPFNMPAVLVQFMPVVDWLTNADGSQTGTLKIQFHIVTTCYSDTANTYRMAQIDKEMAFKHLQVVNKLHTQLQGFAPVNCTALQRIGLYPEQEHDQIHVTILEYKCEWIDNSTADSVINETVEVTPDLVVEHPIDSPTEPTADFANPQQFLL